MVVENFKLTIRDEIALLSGNFTLFRSEKQLSIPMSVEN
jgi:hypothetical protein